MKNNMSPLDIILFINTIKTKLFDYSNNSVKNKVFVINKKNFHI